MEARSFTLGEELDYAFALYIDISEYKPRPLAKTTL